MFGKTSFLILVLSAFFTYCSAQLLDLEEKKPVSDNGIEYGYIIKNEQVKNAKGEEYSRFEITVYANNKSGCTRIFGDRAFVLAEENPNLMATFTCNNANGKRLTAKSGSVKAHEFYLNLKMQENGRDVTRSVKAGYIFRNSEILKENMIVLVPKGERPVIQCIVNNPPELH